MQTLVKMEGITKEFPGVKALDNISLEINAGEVFTRRHREKSQ